MASSNTKFDASAKNDTPQNGAPEKPDKPAYKGPTVKDKDGNDVPFYPAPRSHATDSITRLAARGVEQSKKREDPGLPDSATPEAKASAKWVPLPAGGIAALADSLWPGDSEDQDAMDNHIFDLMLLNNDLIRNDTSHTVGQMVRIPA